MSARSTGKRRSGSGRASSNRLPVWPLSVRSTSVLAAAIDSESHTLQYEDFQAADHSDTLDSVPAADARRLQAHERSLRRLAEQLAGSGFISSGSVVRRYAQCGTSSCRCHADPPQLHGPYWQWSYRPAGGKTVSRQLNERQALLYQEWIANRRRLVAVVAEMEEVSRQAAPILLVEPRPELVTSSDDSGRRRGPTRRVTRPMAEALVQLAELVEPAAEAAREWLESKDDEDHEAIIEARDRLLATLDESPDLATAMTRLVRLLGSVAPQADQDARTDSYQVKSSESTPSLA